MMIRVVGEGYTIDCDYLISVKECMERLMLPSPRRRLRDSDGSILPLISINTEDMQ